VAKVYEGYFGGSEFSSKQRWEQGPSIAGTIDVNEGISMLGIRMLKKEKEKKTVLFTVPHRLSEMETLTSIVKKAIGYKR